MAAKKTAIAPVKKEVTTTKKAAVKKNTMKGQSYTCGICGIVVTVEEDCGCVETCDIICCGKPMKEKKEKAKSKAKAA